MGRFLMIGLKMEMLVRKADIYKHAKNGFWTEESILEQMENVLHLEKFKRTEHDGYLKYSLDKDILDRELMTFLKRFYELRYVGSSKFESDAALAKLESLTNTEERLKLLTTRSYQSYQVDERDGYFYLDDCAFFEIPFITKEMVLSMDGKIMMECYSGVLDFFRRCIVARLDDMEISHAIDVYISD